MARPRRNEHIRDELLERGIDVLSEHGYHGTGIKKILDVVNVPKGSFYNYFHSKEQFVSEIIDKYSTDLLERLDQYLEKTSDDPVTAIKTVYYTAIDELHEKGLKGCLMGNLAAEIAGSSGECRMAMKQAFELWKERFVVLIENAQEMDLLRNDLSPEILSDIFWNTWQGGMLRMKIDNDTEPLKKLVDVMLDVLYR